MAGYWNFSWNRYCPHPSPLPFLSWPHPYHGPHIFILIKYAHTSTHTHMYTYTSHMCMCLGLKGQCTWPKQMARLWEWLNPSAAGKVLTVRSLNSQMDISRCNTVVVGDGGGIIKLSTSVPHHQLLLALLLFPFPLSYYTKYIHPSPPPLPSSSKSLTMWSNWHVVIQTARNVN